MVRPSTILLVDDEEDILRALKLGIERNLRGADVLSVNDPLRALQILSERHVDVIVSDQRMPGMEGVDLLAAARRITPSTARMMMTGFASERLLERNVNDAHIVHFFSKPYKLPEVIEALRRCLDAAELRATRARELAKAIAGVSVRGRNAESYDVAREEPVA